MPKSYGTRMWHYVAAAELKQYAEGMRFLTSGLLILTALTVCGCGAANAPQDKGAGAGSIGETGDGQTIVGYWRVTEATANGDPHPEALGGIYQFEPGGKLEVTSPAYEAMQDYRLDDGAQPRKLTSYFFNPQNAGAGIYELDGDSLRWRTADNAQELSFTAAPQGPWNEYRLVRITASEAKQAIEKIQSAARPDQ